MSDLSFLIYSSLRNNSCSDQEIKNILSSCEKNNPSLDITGVLVHSNNYFLQFLEGNENEIMGLFNNIKKDSRHSKVLLLNKGKIEKRMFPSWHMGYKDVDNEEMSFLTSSSDEEKDAFNNLLKGNHVEDNKALKMLARFYRTVK